LGYIYIAPAGRLVYSTGKTRGYKYMVVKVLARVFGTKTVTKPEGCFRNLE